MIKLDDEIIFISDECLFYKLFSSVPNEVKEAKIIFDYLSYRKFNKKIILPPSVYQRLTRLFEKHTDSLLYFKNYFEEANYINRYNKTQDEIKLLAKVLKTINMNVAIISDSIHGDVALVNELENIQVILFTVHETYSYLWTKLKFREYMQLIEQSQHHPQ